MSEEKFPPAALICVERVRTEKGVGEARRTLHLRSDENQTHWVYATPRGKAIDGVDLIKILIPKDFYQ